MSLTYPLRLVTPAGEGEVPPTIAKYDRFVSWKNIERLAEIWGTEFILHNDGHYRITMTSELIDDLADHILAVDHSRQHRSA